ncbi:hypothetical protein L861_02530 [Litchfieldella anticariensis FP35 = DSM 16096]|uniref:Uncharacterized protein n=1 Tax=Litchfieldella anticariensis (strain DSM 16096 / CECT 5854 / CIP 108499 / LMG 22089 / FP35) TaxID=1121939 RepID=S2L8N8_LITA3|nr:hypothetical protein L861_02530 [Halomonas anticariensis FP35 = DSM 16096]
MPQAHGLSKSGWPTAAYLTSLAFAHDQHQVCFPEQGSVELARVMQAEIKPIGFAELAGGGLDTMANKCCHPCRLYPVVRESLPKHGCRHWATADIGSTDDQE